MIEERRGNLILNDSFATNQIIGTVFNNIDILSDDRYSFSSDDFPQSFHQLLFGSMYNLYNLGVNKVDVIAIEQYLEQRPAMLAEYKANKGAEYLLTCAELAEEDSFDYYYNRFKKFTLLRSYQDLGFNVASIYNPEEIENIKKRQQQEEWLDNSSVEQIADYIEDKIAQVRKKNVDNISCHTVNFGEGLKERIQNLQEMPDYGLPLYGKYINTITRGARPGKLYLRSAATNVGKAIPETTLIPTPYGWRYAKDLKRGDFIFGPNGEATKIIGRYPQGEREAWQITLHDGRIAICDKDHLWRYKRGSSKWQVESTEDLYYKFHHSSGTTKFYIPNNKPVDYPEQNTHLDPYLFGLLMWRMISYKKKTKIKTDVYVAAAGFGNAQKKFQRWCEEIQYASNGELIPEFSSEYGKGYVVLRKQSNGELFTLQDMYGENYYAYPYYIHMDYRIPDEYLMGSVGQRWDLLRGIVDAGAQKGSSTIPRGIILICYRFPKTIWESSVIELLNSLGLHWVLTHYRYNGEWGSNDNCPLYIRGVPDIKKVMTLDENMKKALDKKSKQRKASEDPYTKHEIVDIQPLGYKTPMICFKVDNESECFLMGDYIVTHNTRTMIADACYIGCDEMYNLQTGEWESIGSSEPTLYLSTEQDIDEIQPAAVSFISGVQESHITKGFYEYGEIERVQRAVDIIERSQIHFDFLPNFGLKDIENSVKRNVREFGIKANFVDYLHSSIGVLSEISKRAGKIQLREDQVLFMMMTELKNIANRYNTFICTSSQLNGDYREATVFDQNLLRGAKSQGDSIDYGAIMLEVTEKDKESLLPVVEQLGIDMPNIKMSVFKNRGEWKGILVWMIANKGICRYDPVFVTQYNYQLIPIEDTQIIFTEDKPSLIFS